MAYIELNRKKLLHNYNYLQQLFEKHNIQWGIVTKMLCGNELFLKEILKLGVTQVCDSRTTNLKEKKGKVKSVFVIRAAL